MAIIDDGQANAERVWQGDARDDEAFDNYRRYAAFGDWWSDLTGGLKDLASGTAAVVTAFKPAPAAPATQPYPGSGAPGSGPASQYQPGYARLGKPGGILGGLTVTHIALAGVGVVGILFLMKMKR